MQNTALPDVKHLVRSVLGCACPDQVFDSIDIRPASARFPGLPGDHLIAIGDRLLLLVISSSSWQEVLDPLERLFVRGRELRDGDGFNRFRLVVAVQELGPAQAALTERFRALADADDRMHLHVIGTEVLSALGFTQRGDDS